MVLWNYVQNAYRVRRKQRTNYIAGMGGEFGINIFTLHKIGK